MGCYYFMCSPVTLFDSLHLYYGNVYMYKILPFFCHIKNGLKKMQKQKQTKTQKQTKPKQTNTKLNSISLLCNLTNLCSIICLQRSRTILFIDILYLFKAYLPEGNPYSVQKDHGTKKHFPFLNGRSAENKQQHQVETSVITKYHHITSFLSDLLSAEKKKNK